MTSYRSAFQRPVACSHPKDESSEGHEHLAKTLLNVVRGFVGEGEEEHNAIVGLVNKTPKADLKKLIDPQKIEKTYKKHINLRKKRQWNSSILAYLG